MHRSHTWAQHDKLAYSLLHPRFKARAFQIPTTTALARVRKIIVAEKDGAPDAIPLKWGQLLRRAGVAGKKAVQLKARLDQTWPLKKRYP